MRDGVVTVRNRSYFELGLCACVQARRFFVMPGTTEGRRKGGGGGIGCLGNVKSTGKCVNALTLG